MHIRVLGCHGSKLPGYNTTCFLLDEEILLDAGTITSVLSLEEQIKIEYVLVTHAHLDHVCDIMFLVDNLYYSKKKHPAIRILSTQGVIDALRANLFNNIIWPDFSSIPTPERALLKFDILQLGEKFKLNSFTITSVRVNHTVETIGYVIESESASFIFIGDTGPTEDVWKVARKLKNLKAVFVEVSLPNSMENIADVTGHFTPASLGRELKKLGSIKPDIYLYHMKPQYEETIRKEMDLIENKNIHILSEGEVIKIG
jgi:ribonuclease BN (tRNA processing enzyme)